ncbi:hypothetical protein [Rhizobium sp. SSA_523]|uniref:hypothetical protein n=1 Tax=Rhizobium sp. SSA_523 TaxID=2952477 RepID=UPI002091BA95|nr:hypothetical protein [Rhizobium sp. SSA_523]MCO5730913.1 hypothetical protein [Rhizobium sp. SSA_523]WKC24274.1 hypothetical protein QTJ18_09380 [Rhizobium sp. SSA_523]
MIIPDRKGFYDRVRQSLYPGYLTKEAVDGHETILSAWDRLRLSTDRRKLAYVLATAFHETGGRMQPMEENLHYSVAGLRRTFRTMLYWNEPEELAGHPEKLANRIYASRMGNGDSASGDGYRFRGRGLVQITGRVNYRAFGIEDRPEAALEPERAVMILIHGMVRGSFTGHRLADYFAGSRADWLGARRIVNGNDRAADLARYARLYVLALSAGDLPEPGRPETSVKGESAEEAGLSEGREPGARA